MLRAWWLIGLLVGATAGALGLATCDGSPAGVPEPPGVATVRRAAVEHESASPLAARFATEIEPLRDLGHEDFLRQLPPQRDARLSFDPRSARYYDEVARALGLTDADQVLLRTRGLVAVAYGSRLTMGGAYYAIYARDLPVLVTSDSILHAWHRSFDAILKQLEADVLLPALAAVLAATHARLATVAGSVSDDRVRLGLADADLYLTVARNLLAGAAAPSGPARYLDWPPSAAWDGTLKVTSVMRQDGNARQILKAVTSLETNAEVTLWGGRRPVDFSQFKPRGHYTESETLGSYFRAMMWLGRADLGFLVDGVAPEAGLMVVVERERRAAAVLTRLMADAGALERLAAISRLVDLLVGRSDNLTPMTLAAALYAAGITSVDGLADPAPLAAVVADLVARGAAGQQIRSQTLGSHPRDPRETPIPAVWQLFGQRLAVDSFVLSRVVYDSISFAGAKQLRLMPTGLDVSAALGDDEAARLLAPELERYHYAANLLAARRTVASLPPEAWTESVYAGWLHSLRALGQSPAGQVPEAMQTRAWRDKQLQTQLASWAELRHDTILYAKQSDTAMVTCSYPTGFVEPYPEFYARSGAVAQKLADLVAAVGAEIADTRHILARDFLRAFAHVMARLELMARKELDGQPFTADEEAFLKRTISMTSGGGCGGPPTYDGWYPDLIYDRDPAKWEPIVADVHTDPNGVHPQALEIATGDVDLLAIAIDNRGDRAIYVGPISSYYELHQPTTARLTDEEWRRRLIGGPETPRPAWARSFLAPAADRTLSAVHKQTPR